MEAAMMEFLRCRQGMQGKDIHATFEEHEASETPESLSVHDVDKTELLLQMVCG